MLMLSLPFTVLLFPLHLFLLGLLLAGLSLHALTDGSQEWFQVSEQFLLRHTGLPVQQKEQLTFHQVHLGQRETKVISLHSSVPSPVLVLGAGVVQVLSGEDQRSKEDPVDGATHALGHGRQTGTQAAEVDEGAHERGDLDL